MRTLSLSDEKIIGIVTPIAENMETGWDEDNYEIFSEHFSEEMKQVVNINNYSKQRSKFFPDQGSHTKLEFVLVHKNPTNLTAIWNIYYEKRETPALLICSFEEINENLKIVGAIVNW